MQHTVSAPRHTLQESTAQTTVSFGANRYGIDPQHTEQYTRQVKPVQVNSADSKVRIGKIKGMNSG